MKKKILLLFLCTILGAMSAMALEAYVERTNRTTLTFKYGARPTSGTTYSLNTSGTEQPGWYLDGANKSITNVIFDSSFNQVRPIVTTMWFYQMDKLTTITNLNYLHTDAVTDMSGMFFECSKFTTLDLSDFNTSNVTNMLMMFNNCSSLTTIYVGSGWNTDNVEYSGYMFNGCINLVGGAGTTYNASHIDKAYAHIDGGTSNPGYFTNKNAPVAYVERTNRTTLTFKYGLRPTSGTTYSLNTGNDIPEWVANNANRSIEKVIFDSSFDQARPTSTATWFERMPLTSITGLEYLHTDAVTTMCGMFNGSSITSLDLSHFNTSNVTDMLGMFVNCSSITSLDLTSFNTRNVTNMDMMFANCFNLTTIQVGNNWSTNNVTTSNNMFYGSTSLVGSMGTTYDANHIDKEYAHIDLGPQNPGYLSMYDGAGSYAIFTESDSTLTFRYGPRPVGAYEMNTNSEPAWCTDDTRLAIARVVFDPSFAQAHPTSTYAWFKAMPNLKSITGWEYLNTDAVTTMFQMFYSCPSLTTLDLSHFNTSNVTNMKYMFAACTSLTTLDLTSFNTSNVRIMDYMFAADVYNNAHTYSSNLTTILVGSGWNTNSVTSSNYMFDDCFKLVGGLGTTYDANHIDKAYAHIDGGPSNPGYFTDANAQPYAIYDAATTTLTFTHGILPEGAYALNEGTNQPGWVTDNTCQSVTKVVFDPSFDQARPTSTYLWFYNMPNLTSITGWKYFHTDSVVVMRQMFQNCKLSTLDLTNFNTSKVTNMYSMFNNCPNLNIVYVGDGWTTDNVFNSSYMFYGCTNLVGGQGTAYDANHIDKAYAHIDGGASNPGYFTNGNLNAYAQYNSNMHTLMFYCAASPQEGGNGIKNYELPSDYLVEPEWVTDSICRSVTRVIFNSSFNQARPITTYKWFADMENLTTITGWEYLHTDEVEVMAFMFKNCSKLTAVNLSHFNTSKVVYMIGMFVDCTSLQPLDVSSFNTSNVLSMNGMFSGCSSLTRLELGNFNTSNVTNMSYMFWGCTSLSILDVSSFDTQNVEFMQGMFAGCDFSTIDLNNFDTRNVTDMTHMFNSCTNLTSLDVTGFDTRKVTSMQGTFAYCSSLTSLNLRYFNIQNVTDMQNMFQGCSSLTSLDLSGYADISFNTSKVLSMAYMFDGCSSLTELTFDSKFFKADNATNLSHMFSDCSSLTSLNLGYFNPVKAKYMVSMFQGCSSLTDLNIGNFGDTEALERIDFMFDGCSSLESLDLSGIYTGNVTNMFCTFRDCSNLKTIYVGSDWSTANVTSSYYMFENCTSLVGGQGTAYDANHTNDDYAHIDEGTSDPGYLTGETPYVVYNPNTTTLTFKYGLRPSGAYGLNTEYQAPKWITKGHSNDVTNVVIEPSFDQARPTSCYMWFVGMENVPAITGLEYLHTDEATNMHAMFSGCSGLTSLNLSHFNTNKVTKMRNMFNTCSNLETIYVGSGWNTDNVTASEGMFSDCTSLVGGMGTVYDASHTDKAYAHIDGGTSNPGYFSVYKAPYVVYDLATTTLTFAYGTPPDGAYSLNEQFDEPEWCNQVFLGDITTVVFDESFDNVKPTTTWSWFANMTQLTTITGWEYLHTDQTLIMGGMFMNCINLTSIDLSHFNTNIVVNMSAMFGGCNSLTGLDLSTFNTDNVLITDWMFSHCLNLTSLDLSTFNTSNVLDMRRMFYDCPNLATIYVGDGWSTAYVDSEYSQDMFYGCTNLVGGKGTTYDPNHLDKAYAHIDGGTINPGYFTEKPAKPGDANGDGKVDVNDVTSTINYILGKNPSPFIFENANVNGDSKVDVMDVTLIINIILGVH